jgi:hypothetical protein
MRGAPHEKGTSDGPVSLLSRRAGAASTNEQKQYSVEHRPPPSRSCLVIAALAWRAVPLRLAHALN